MEHSDQILRIKQKLEKAKEMDKDFQVFGASSHRYLLGEPLKEEEVLAFENRYQITLPPSYRAFLTQLGNGGISYANSAAGPFYGVYPLGYDFEESGAHQYARFSASIFPTMTEEDWEKMTEPIWGDESDLSDI